MKKIIFLCLLALISCSKDEFSANKQSDKKTAPASAVSSTSSCAGFTLIKPEVDFLFLWDNTSSQFFVDPNLKIALNNVFTQISPTFNFRAMVAPLRGTGNAQAFVVAESSTGLTIPSGTYFVTKENAGANTTNFITATGSSEFGLDRAVSLLTNNNGFFRQGSNVIIVVMSNGDQIKTFSGGNAGYDGPGTAQLIADRKSELLNLKQNILHSAEMRFFSIVSHSTCQLGYKANESYKKMSQGIFSARSILPVASIPTATPDSYDICGTSYTGVNIFDGINGAISEVLLKHKYDHWPVVASNGCLEILSVKKQAIPGGTSTDIFDNATNGYTNMGMQTNINTRYQPTVGEPYTGHVIQLNGTAKASYPECIVVETKTPTVNYGYVHMANCPLESTISLRINGAVIPKNATNGWQYFGRANNLNITTNSSTCVSPETKSGFFLKLYGSAVYSSGANVQVDYNTSTSCP
jgi:hypothetical protein